MALPAALVNTMPYTVIVRPFASQTVSGTITYGSSLSVKARIEPATEKDMRLHGFEKMPVYRIILDTTANFDERAEIELPSGFPHPKPRILKVKRAADTRYLPHTVVYC